MNDWVLLVAVPFVVGIFSAFAAQWIRALVAQLTNRIAIRGVWGEWIDGDERNYSIGHIYYDLRHSRWAFDGTNYHNDGTPFCHWKTKSSHIDRHEKRYYYIFENTHAAEVHTGYTGFGFIELERVKKRLMPHRGAFSAGNPGESFRSHTMVQLESLPDGPESALEIFEEIVPSASRES